MVVIGAVLRLKGIHSPILDHPGWRQGDTAAIARNFATLRYNIFFPQTDYNGPPPNYVELELQIVPFLAATLYKLFGVHEIFGRLISLAFGLGTIALVGAFARRLFVSEFAGVAAAALYAIFPGSIYYSRTFMPDTAMVFFFTAAIYACARYFWDEETDSWRGFPAAALLLLAAFLAKPVAVVAIVPIACASIARFGWAGTLRRPQTYALLAVAFIPLVLYDRFVAAHAEWHWASGITQKHVIPSLLAAFTSGHAFVAKFHAFVHVFHLLRTTMLGPVGLALLVLGFAVPYRKRDGALLYGWLAGALVYAYIVVTVERVDYYLYLVLPLAALVGAWRSPGQVSPSPRCSLPANVKSRPTTHIANRTTSRRARSMRRYPKMRWWSWDTTIPRCCTTSTAKAGRKTPISGRRSTSKVQFAKVRAT